MASVLRLFQFVATAAFLCAPACTQNIPLTVAFTPIASDGMYSITIVNDYAQPAIAYGVLPIFTKRDLPAVMWSDSVPSFAGNLPLAPHQSHTRQGKTNEDSLVDVKVVAAIFADGANFGERDYIDALLFARKQEVADINAIVQQVDLLKAEPTADGYAAFLAFVEKRQQDDREHVLQSPPFSPVGDGICREVEIALRNDLNAPMPTRLANLQALRAKLANWLSQLQASRPPLE